MVVALNVPEAQQETLYKELQQAVTRGVSIGFFRRNGTYYISQFKFYLSIPFFK